MPALGALVVGIGTYKSGESFPSVPPLRYAMEDANAIEEYLKACWSESDGRQIASVGADLATLYAIREAISDLSKHGRYDLFVVYLSGHGNAGTAETGFLTQPTTSGLSAALLSPLELDRMLGSIDADRVVFILDCCFAEAIVGKMNFFHTLGTSEARLFIASSRADQITWEEESAQHGVFTAFLIDRLRLGGAKQRSDTHVKIDVDAELFPFLCNQVPLFVLERKNAHQEPVKGGVARAPVFLPMHRTVRSLRERTVLGTALRRVRQILIAASIAACLAITLIYGLLYYAETNSSGEIVLRHGTRWLEPVLRHVEPVRLQTGIQVASLSPNPADRYPVQSGSLVGIWTHHTRGGYRAWYDRLSATLAPEARRHYDVLVGRTVPDAVQWPSALEARPEDAAFAAWAVLVQPSSKTVDWALRAIPGADRLQTLGKPFDPNYYDFGTLDLSVTQIAAYLQALEWLAITDPDRSLQAYLGFLMAMQEWVYQHRSERFDLARARVTEAVSASLAFLAARRVDAGMPALPAEVSAALVQLMGNGYFDTAASALANVAGDPDRDTALRRAALAYFDGDAIGVEQLVAMRVLARAADSSPDSLRSVERVIAFFRRTGNPENAYLTKFLIDVADHRGLPASALQDLLRKARDVDTREFQFLDQENARILAHALSQLSLGEREIAYRLIDQLASNIADRSETLAEIYGVAARQLLDQPSMLNAVILQCSGLTDRSFNPNEDPDHQIIVGGVGWAVALAEFGKTRSLPEDARELLRHFAKDLRLRPFQRDFDLALARQDSYSGKQCSKHLCLERLRYLKDSSSERALQTRLLARQFASLSRATFSETLAHVRRLHAVETEPELRIALGELIVTAQETRILDLLPDRTD